MPSAMSSLANIGKTAMTVIGAYYLYEMFCRKKMEYEESGVVEEDDPNEDNSLNCKISGEQMENPYKIRQCGHTFEYLNIVNRLDKMENKCPVCGQRFKKEDLVPNHVVLSVIEMMNKNK